MSNIYLEKLMRKPTPKIEKGGLIIFDVNKDKNKDVQIDPNPDKDEEIEPNPDKDEEIEPNPDKDEEIEPNPDKDKDKEIEPDKDKDDASNDNFENPTLFKIIDKREQANIDRNLILERLYNRSVMNYEHSIKEVEKDDVLDIETINKPVKKKRIIISENQINKTFDENEEETQPKSVKAKKISTKTVSIAPLNDYKIGEKKIVARIKSYMAT